MRRAACAQCGLLLSLFTLATGPTQEAPAQAGNALLRIGMPQTFFHDVPDAIVGFATEPFSAVMRDTTGLSGKLVPGGDPLTVADQLSKNKIQLGVFHGFEFAWVQQKHPELKPLMLAVNTEHEVAAYVLVLKSRPMDTFADLKGKDFAVPKRTREHCRLFIERHCQGDGACEPKAFFSRIVASQNVETALDDLCQQRVDAVVVDAIGVAFYKDLKPGCFAKFRVLARSEAFVPPVIAYLPSSIDEATLGKVRDGLLKAHKTPMGGEMMKMWKITSFEPVPSNFSKSLADSIRAYPAPEAK
jgi:ABC-type phosphate/phosphonate transport system substrate-binding protein